ncbi:MAG: hypothetical protein KF764_16960 [Labilithrix sp.]|nr:hypothetical protein [Labilithrix sp.]
MDDIEVTIHFPGASAAAANDHVQELERVLRENAANDDVDLALSRRKERADTQDIGTILVATLSTPAFLALAKGIATLIGQTGSRIEIRADGSVVASGDGINKVDVARVVEALKTTKAKHKSRR